MLYAISLSCVPGHARVKGNLWLTGGQSNPLKWFASWKIWSVEELETLPADTKPMTSHHWLPGEERCGKRSARWSSLKLKGWERAIVNQMNIGTVSKAMLGKLLRDGVECVGFSRCIDTSLELNWTELCLTAFTVQSTLKPCRSSKIEGHWSYWCSQWCC